METIGRVPECSGWKFTVPETLQGSFKRVPSRVPSKACQKGVPSKGRLEGVPLRGVKIHKVHGMNPMMAQNKA